MWLLGVILCVCLPYLYVIQDKNNREQVTKNEGGICCGFITIDVMDSILTLSLSN
jgi:hypothetical protein